MCRYTPPSYSQRITPSGRFKSFDDGDIGAKAFNFSTRNRCQASDFKSTTTSGWFIDPTLRDQLDAWIQNLSLYAGYYGAGLTGKVEWLGHLGVLRTSRGGSSYHYHGKAMDIGWIQFETADSRPCSANPNGGSADNDGIDTEVERRRYLAVEASLRKYFGYVLNYRIKDHDNHYHVDNAGGNCPPGFHADMFGTSRRSTSVTFFIQNCINWFTTDLSATADGVYGRDTDAKWTALLAKMGLDCFDPRTNNAHYMLFLDFIMAHGLANKPAGHFQYGLECPVN